MSLIQRAWETVTPWENIHRDNIAKLNACTGLSWEKHPNPYDGNAGYRAVIKDMVNAEQIEKDSLEKINLALGVDGKKPFTSTIWESRKGIGLGNVVIFLFDEQIHNVDFDKALRLSHEESPKNVIWGKTLG